MIRFLTLTLRNFLSYGNNVTVFNLERPGATLIVGEDLDNTVNGQGANGVGKSALINALTYAVYDKPISKISKDNLVNNVNGKNMEVTLEFTTGDGHLYKIKRERKTKAGAAGNNVYFYVDGEDKSVDSSGTNKLIVDTVGIPYDLFVRMVVYSASHTPFLDLPVTHATAPNQTDIIEELFDLKLLSAKAEELKKQIKDAETSLAIKKAKVEQQERDAARQLGLIENAKKRVDGWELQTRTAIEQYRQQLLTIDTIDFDAERENHQRLKDVKQQWAAVNEQYKTEKRKQKELVVLYQQKEEELKHLQDAKCPYCLQDFAGAQSKIQVLVEETEQLFQQLETLDPMVKQLFKDLEQLEQQVTEAESQITIPNLESLQKIRSQSDTIRSKIEDLEQASNPFVEPLKELEQAHQDTIDYTEVNQATKEIEHQKFLYKLLTKKDSFVRKELMNKNLPFLNKKLRDYLTELGLPHVVEFNHNMTATISQFGREMDFGNLSAGQAARVNLALSWGFKDVRERRSKRVNIYMLDEALDHGLDAIGVESAARLIKMKAAKEGQSIYVVSHRSEIENVFPKTITIQRSKGFSYIKENEEAT